MAKIGHRYVWSVGRVFVSSSRDNASLLAVAWADADCYLHLGVRPRFWLWGFRRMKHDYEFNRFGLGPLMLAMWRR